MLVVAIFGFFDEFVFLVAGFVVLVLGFGVGMVVTAFLFL